MVKIKSFCSEKDNTKRIRGQATNWEQIFAKDTSNKGLLYKIHKVLLQLNNQKGNNPLGNNLKNGPKTSTDTSFKDDVKMANKHKKRRHIISGKCKLKQQ